MDPTTQRLHLSIADGGRPISGILSSSPRLSASVKSVTTPPGAVPPSPTRVYPQVMRPESSYSTSSNAASEVVRPPDMDTIPWYHYNISRHVAESVLISTGEDGSYLLRDSGNNPGDFSLSVRSKDAVKHFPVRWDGTHFLFGFAKFTEVSELISHFENKPVIGGDSGILTILKYPYPRSVIEPDVYDSIRVHAEGGSASSVKDKPTFAIASKEGFLTKLGQHRKNWKTRWFVLYKNEFSYYKTREDKVPIRVINLKDMSSVGADNSQGKENCFRVVTSTRTFFLIAFSAQEAEDWIKILKWKLEHSSGVENYET